MKQSGPMADDDAGGHNYSAKGRYGPGFLPQVDGNK